MGHVMARFRIIGRGRAGGSIRAALAARGWQDAGFLGRDDDPSGAARDVDLLILAVRDDAIESVARSVDEGDAVVAHLSGAKTLDALGPHARTASIHPLVSLPDPATGARRLLHGATFAVAGDPIARAVVDALGGRAITVGDEHRALYHAAAAVAANHLVALTGQVERLAESVGVPVDAYWDLMSATLDNVRSDGSEASLTGPAARGDLETIRNHLDALPPSERDLYLALADEAARLADRDAPSVRLTPPT